MIAFGKLQELISGAAGDRARAEARQRRLFAGVAGPGARSLATGHESQALLVGIRCARRARPRRADGAGDRRRRHARRDLAAERVHRPRDGVDRLRALEQRAHHRRHARRRLGHPAHADDGQGDEPLARQRPLRRVRHRRRRRPGGAAPAATAQRPLDAPPTTSPCMLAYARRVVDRPRLRPGRRPGPAQRARAGRPARAAAASTCATRSTRSPAACRGT